MRKITFAFLLSTITFLVILATPVLGAKKFVPKVSQVKSVKKVASSGIPSVVRYRGDKQGILLSFSNFRGIDSVSYLFTYNTNGVAQGAGGTISAGNNPTAERQLLFGTCSTSVCTYHYNLTGAKLTITAKYLNGTTKTKIYRIKTYQ